MQDFGNVVVELAVVQRLDSARLQGTAPSNMPNVEKMECKRAC